MGKISKMLVNMFNRSDAQCIRPNVVPTPVDQPDIPVSYMVHHENKNWILTNNALVLSDARANGWEIVESKVPISLEKITSGTDNTVVGGTNQLGS